MVRSPPQNSNDSFVDNWVGIGALIPMSPRSPYVVRRRRNLTSIHKRRYIPSKIMVKSAIKTLTRNPRAGVSFVAIKKFIAENYHDTFSDKNNRFHFVKRCIKKSLENGELIRTKGVGVSGSFRLPHTQNILKRKRTSHKKNKQLHKAKTVKENKKEEREQMKDLNSKTSSAKVNSNSSGEGEGDVVGVSGGGDADEHLSNSHEKIVKTVSKVSVRKMRKSIETNL